MTTTQLNTPKAKMANLRSALEKSLPNIQAVAAKHLTPERMVKVVLGAASRNPLLLECTPVSVVKAVLQAAELGLEPGGALGDFYLVPFKNGKTGQREVQGIPGYRGLISLARRSGEIANLYAEAVYEGDEFEVSYGLDLNLAHKPNFESDQREDPRHLRFVYAVARFKDGTNQFVVLSRKQIEGLRRRSKASDSGPWVTDYEEMAKKTAIRRLAKYLPLSPEMGKALELQERAEIGESTLDIPVMSEDVMDAVIVDDDSPQVQSEDPLKAVLKAKQTPTSPILEG